MTKTCGNCKFWESFNVTNCAGRCKFPINRLPLPFQSMAAPIAGNRVNCPTWTAPESEDKPSIPSEAPRCETQRSGPRWLPLGEVCHGSYRMDDLFPTVLKFANRFWDTIAHEDMNSAKIVNQCQAHWLTEFDADSELTADLYGELCGALEAVVPPFCYFGANEGDSSSIGVWVNDDAIKEAMESGVLVKAAKWPDVACEYGSWDYVLVSDQDGSYQELCERKGGIMYLIWQIK
jgi:hypothetical protein